MEFCQNSLNFVEMENEQDYASYSAGLLNMDFDKNLGAYPIGNELEQWQGLSNVINFDLIEKMKENEKITEKQENGDKNENDIKNDKKTERLNLEGTVDEIQKKLDQMIINEKNDNNDKKLHFTDVPSTKIFQGLKDEKLTKYNFDKSQILNDLKKINENMIGELQIAFI